jgi:hypothetical protein
MSGLMSCEVNERYERAELSLGLRFGDLRDFLEALRFLGLVERFFGLAERFFEILRVFLGLALRFLGLAERFLGLIERLTCFGLETLRAFFGDFFDLRFLGLAERFFGLAERFFFGLDFL